MKKYSNPSLIKFIVNKIKHLKPKVIALLLLIIIIFSVIIGIIVVNNSKQKWVTYTGDNLNENRYPGYKEAIDKLKKEHPNWEFTLFYTKLDWKDVIKSESHSNKNMPLNLIPKADKYSKDWECKKDKGKTYDNGNWLCASSKAIEYKMDPRVLLNENDIFQIKDLQYTEDSATEEGIMKKTKNTFLEGSSIAEAILTSGKDNNIDPYFIVSRLIQEQGKKGTKLSRGYKYKDKIVYNPFNIAASGNSQSTIINNAAEYAYSHEWFSLEKALSEGVNFINTKYINEKQNTLYLQKFDIIKENTLYNNQYMQNLLAPTSESQILIEQYENSNTLDSNFNFIIPLYENMPNKLTKEPKGE